MCALFSHAAELACTRRSLPRFASQNRQAKLFFRGGAFTPTLSPVRHHSGCIAERTGST